jgi:ribulose bisphosphate carboxylase small subunit
MVVGAVVGVFYNNTGKYVRIVRLDRDKHHHLLAFVISVCFLNISMQELCEG